MKKQYFNIFLLLLFVVILCNSAIGSTYINLHSINISTEKGIVEDCLNQFKDFVEVNRQLRKQNKLDKLNYVFVYRPGEQMEFYRNIPTAFLAFPPDPLQGGWLRVIDPANMPFSDVFREQLNHYNNLQIPN